MIHCGFSVSQLLVSGYCCLVSLSCHIFHSLLSICLTVLCYASHTLPTPLSVWLARFFQIVPKDYPGSGLATLTGTWGGGSLPKGEDPIRLASWWGRDNLCVTECPLSFLLELEIYGKKFRYGISQFITTLQPKAIHSFGRPRSVCWAVKRDVRGTHIMIKTFLRSLLKNPCCCCPYRACGKPRENRCSSFLQEAGSWGPYIQLGFLC